MVTGITLKSILPSFLPLNFFNYQYICWQPIHLSQIIQRKPCSSFMFQKYQMSFFDTAPIACHSKVEFWIIIFYSCKVFFNGNISR